MAYYGVLGVTFKINRILQAVSLIAILGMTANFISQMVQSNATPPKVLVGTLSVVSANPKSRLWCSPLILEHQTCIAVLYCAITFILFMDNILSFLINTGTDILILIAVIVVAVTVGKPLSYLDCNVIGKMSGDNASALSFANSLANNLDKEGGKVSYSHWIGASKANCLEMKAIWGLSIALWYGFTSYPLSLRPKLTQTCSILFTFSAVCSAFLWKQNRSAPSEKSYEQFDA